MDNQIVIPGTSHRFIAKEKFVPDISVKAKVKINHLSNLFIEHFLAGEGKIEDSIKETTLRHQTLHQPFIDNISIITKLGGEKKSETTLYEMFSLMGKQGKGEPGVLFNNGWVTVFYIPDVRNILRAVYIRFHRRDGWDVYTYPIEYWDGWRVCYRIFSRIN